MNFDLNKKTLREVNQYLQKVDRKKNTRKFEILYPQGQLALCAGFKDFNLAIKESGGDLDLSLIHI